MPSAEGRDYKNPDGWADAICPVAELAMLAKSWLHPAAIEIKGAGFESKGYDLRRNVRLSSDGVRDPYIATSGDVARFC